MGFKVVLRVMAFCFDMTFPVLARAPALVRHAVPYTRVKYFSRHTLIITQGYVKKPFGREPIPAHPTFLQVTGEK